MKKFINFILIMAIYSTPAISGSYTDEAQVVSIEDVYRDHTTKQPYQDCYIEKVRQKSGSDNSATNEIFGGIIGGVIGNQFGGGSGKDISTVAGALLGASIANDDEQHYKMVDQQVCRTKYNYSINKRFSHYLITYRYNKNVYSYTSNKRPNADNIRVRVNIVPIM